MSDYDYDLLVTGGYESSLEGTYKRVAIPSGTGLPSDTIAWSKDGAALVLGSPCILFVSSYGDMWNIGNFGMGISYEASGCTDPEECQWSDAEFGNPDAEMPTVTKVTPPPPAHDIAVNPLTAQADITQTTLRQTHKLSASPLTASGNITQPTLRQTHELSATALSASGNITQPTLRQTHVIDIEPLWAQIELSDLTLAQYIRTPTPDCRRLTIHAEDRTLVIPREDRTLKIKCCE